MVLRIPDRKYCACKREFKSKQISADKIVLPIFKHDIPPSFLPPNVLKSLCRELDREVVEWEFNFKMRYALEEAYRVTSNLCPANKSSRQSAGLKNIQKYPRLFYRASAKFELLDSLSLKDLKPLDYLGRHVHICPSRKNLLNDIFNCHREDSSENPRYMLTSNLCEALQDLLNRPVQTYELDRLEQNLGEKPLVDKIDFRTWCGVAALAERLLATLSPRDQDLPTWLERADFEGLDRKLANVELDQNLINLLKLIRDH